MGGQFKGMGERDQLGRVLESGRGHGSGRGQEPGMI